MFRKRIIFLHLIILAISLLFFSCGKVLALDIDNERPTPLWGVPSAEWTDPTSNQEMKSYGEPESTIIIRNTAPELLPDMQFLTDCALNSGTTLANCFYFISDSSAKLLNSKTYVNNKMKSAVAILRYGGVNVFGDSNSASGDFLYWGRHLRQSRDNSSSNSYWETKSYSFNPDAQAFWDINDPNKNIVMSETIERLKRSSKSPTKILSGLFPGNIRILTPTLFDGVCGYLNSVPCLETSTHPEGALWYEDGLYESNGFAGGLGINQPLKYQNKGTFLIDKGGLFINASVNKMASSTDGALGFIVTDGDVVIQNYSNNAVTVRVSIFAPNGTIRVQGDRINLIGSFVAKDFIVDSTVDVANFIQDTRGEASWPPGFRELKLPLVSSR
jgi:hypothetical protein